MGGNTTHFLFLFRELLKQKIMKYFKVLYTPWGELENKTTLMQAEDMEDISNGFFLGDIVEITEISLERYNLINSENNANN